MRMERAVTGRSAALRSFGDGDFEAIVRGSGSGTKTDPWRFEGEGGFPSSIAYRDKTADPPLLIVEVGGQVHRFPLDSLDRLCAIEAEAGEESVQRENWLRQLRAFVRRALGRA